MAKRLEQWNSDVGKEPSRWQSRGLLLALLIGLTLLASIIYAGPAFGTVSYRLMFDGGLTLLWLASATGLGLFIARPLLKDLVSIPAALRFVTMAGLGLGAVSLALLGLGLLGWLNALTAWGLVGIGLILGIVRIIRLDTPEMRAALNRWFSESAGVDWLWLLLVPTFVVMLVGAMFPPGLLWSPDEPHGYDVVEYHLQVPREWYEAGRIIRLHHNAFSYFPFNVEMHYLLAMHLRDGPWAGMYLAQLMHGGFILLSILAVYGIARWSGGRLSAVIAAIAMGTAPWIGQLGAIAYDDGGLLLFGTLAIGWAMIGLRSGMARAFLIAGIMAGLACGAKLTAVPEVVIPIFTICVAIAVFRLLRRLPASRQALTGAVIFGGVAVLLFAPWMGRNIAWSGNPVFPELSNLFGRDHFSEVQVERWNRAHAAPPAERSLRGRCGAYWNQVLAGWQFGFVAIPLGILAAGFSIRRNESQFLFALLILLTIFWICFTHLQGRFYVLALPIAALLLAQIWQLETISRPAQAIRASIIAIVVIASILSEVLLNGDLLSRLYSRELPLAPMLGVDGFDWLMPKALEQVPADAPIILVGDARAFWYPIPMSRLRYRTIFDADTSNGRGLLDAWAGPPQDRRNAWLWIDPEEFKRFARTYQPCPTVPPEIAAHEQAYLVGPQSAAR